MQAAKKNVNNMKKQVFLLLQKATDIWFVLNRTEPTSSGVGNLWIASQMWLLITALALLLTSVN